MPTAEARRLRALVDACPFGLGLVDADLRFLRVNPVLAAINGVPAEDHEGRTPHQVVPDVADAVVEGLRTVQETGRPLVGRIVTGTTPGTDGEVHTWEASWFPVPQPGGRTGVGVAVIEVSERIAAERLAAGRGAILATAERAAGLGSFEHDLTTGRVQVSDGLLGILGLPDDQAPVDVASLNATVAEDDRERSLQELHAALAAGADGFRMRLRLRGPAGLRWVEARGRIERADDGTPRQVRAVVIDMTDQIAREDALRAAAQREAAAARVSRAIAEDLPTDRLLALVADEAFGIAGGPFLGISRMDGDDWELVEGRGTDAPPPGTRGPTDPAVDLAAMRAGQSVRTVVADLRPEGQAARATPGGVRHFLLVPIRVRGEMWGLIAVGGSHRPTDEVEAAFGEFAKLAAAGIAHAERAEDLRRTNTELERRVEERTAELQASLAELDAFAYSLSHDLRAPLRAVHAAAEILEEELADPGPEAARMLGLIRDSAGGMHRLIDDLLRLARLGSTPLEAVPVDMARLVDDALEALAPDLDGRRVEVVRDPLPPALGDPVLLGQVVQNALTNALTFTRDRPDARVHIGHGPVDGREAYFVRDNGVGLDPAHAERAFGLFERLHPEGRFPGTGAGLAIVRRVVQRHGGQAWLTGRPGEGATLAFTLPLAP